MYLPQIVLPSEANKASRRSRQKDLQSTYYFILCVAYAGQLLIVSEYVVITVFQVYQNQVFQVLYY